MVSNKVKRNITAVLLAVGIACTISRVWEVAMAPTSGRAWFEACGILLLTYFCFDSFKIYHRRTKQRN